MRLILNILTYLNIKYFLTILIVITVIIMSLLMQLKQDNNSSIAIPETILFTPVHTLMSGEEIIYISEGLETRHNNLSIGGGTIMERNFTDTNDVQRDELTVNIHIYDEIFVGYEGYEWNYGNYHIRVLEIDNIGFAVLAISEYDSN